MGKKPKWKAPLQGSTFEKEYSGRHYTLKVVESPNGIVYVLNGRTFETPTAAAKSLTNSEINGWKFWNMNIEELPSPRSSKKVS
jgi:hypothetical protein